MEKSNETTNSVTEVESLCMNCLKNGTTRLLYTKIPFFQEVIISSFMCRHCHYKSTEVLPAKTIQTHGCRYTLHINNIDDLNRQIVKSNTATVRIPHIDFEIPPKIGKLTTVEGIIANAIEELSLFQPQRLISDPATAQQIEDFLPQLTNLITRDPKEFKEFIIELDDPSGNSFTENPFAPKSDHNLKQVNYIRTKEQNQLLGLDSEDTYKEGANILKEESEFSAKDEEDQVAKGGLNIPAQCSNCGASGFSKMCLTDIPFFKQIIIFAFKCDKCGYKDNEVKSGGAISAKGCRITLFIRSAANNNHIKTAHEDYEEDMKRDVVKSTSSAVLIPEIGLEISTGSLGGLYTTVEGLLQLAYEKLFDSELSFGAGDSAEAEKREKLNLFETKFKQVLSGGMDFTLVLDDPLDNSYIYSPNGPENDLRLKVEKYERSYEQNEEFGLNDIKTDDYSVEDEKKTENKEEIENIKHLQFGGSRTHPHDAVVAKPEGF